MPFFGGLIIAADRATESTPPADLRMHIFIERSIAGA